MMRFPPYLKKGSKIGITCPAGAVKLQEIENMFIQLRNWGFELVIGNTVGTSFQKFSAPDEERVQDLQQMLDDESIDAILFGRGGYGVVRIIDEIDFTKFNSYPKWLLGYSDITCFHNHLNTQFRMSTIHAHMNGGYQMNYRDELSTQSIYDVLCGKKIRYENEHHQMNRFGNVSGELVGGNLALISDLIGTKSDIQTNGKILLLEDIGEYIYNLDRMLWQLLRAKKLENLVGLIVGGFTDSLDNETPFGMSEYEIVWEKVRDFKFPVCFNFPVGHQPRNVALKLGAHYKFVVNETGVVLEEKNTPYI